ncbi:folylpolyglutamate synthase [Achlya hypogyna]|uniref:Folylpolyglutamate synthase n=1 Tax=Achlya hypogyna TaxID=1202772 RepID=A0A1V9ZN13_ACHHY|nr:folylpolyglutamate synthase [Achlya hypogyna]
MTAYDALLKRLLGVNQFSPAVKMGLRNSLALHDALGHPAKRFDTIHVAGTNGKGSVSWKLAKALEASGYKTGLFVSPHVACFRERIQVNSTLIPEAAVASLLPPLFALTEDRGIPATFFELTTMLALQHFAAEDVDCVVLETGLGGRLDSTNIVTPVLSVITSIGLDHTRILGSTIEEIAGEKAGIMKPSVPVVIGPQTPTKVMQQHAIAVGSPLVSVPARPAHATDYNAENSDVAFEAAMALNRLHGQHKTKLTIDTTSSLVQKMLQSRPPCRFEVVAHKGATVVLDVAHNMPAFKCLVRLLQMKFPERSLRFVCGFSADKDMAHVVHLLTTLTSPTKVHFVQGYHPRCATMTEIQAAVGATTGFHFHDAVDAASSVAAGVTAAIDVAADDVVVVCGSVFIMAEARAALGFDEPQDSDELKRIAGAGVKTALERNAK